MIPLAYVICMTVDVPVQAPVLFYGRLVRKKVIGARIAKMARKLTTYVASQSLACPWMGSSVDASVGGCVRA